MKKRLIVSPGKNGMRELHVEEMDIPCSDEELDLSLDNMDIFYFVVSGYGTLKVEGYIHSLSPQTGVFIPANSDHYVSNTGNVDMKIIRYYTKGGR